MDSANRNRTLCGILSSPRTVLVLHRYGVRRYHEAWSIFSKTGSIGLSGTVYITYTLVTSKFVLTRSMLSTCMIHHIDDSHPAEAMSE